MHSLKLQLTFKTKKNKVLSAGVNQNVYLKLFVSYEGLE